MITNILIKYLMLFFSFSLFASCETEENKDFEMQCDCRVYNNEITTATYPFGKVSFIDTSTASGCAKEQLENVFMLYYDSSCIAVYNVHPKDMIQSIKEMAKKYHTDTTKLVEYIKYDSSIVITISRFCNDTSFKPYYNEYVEWKSIVYLANDSQIVKLKEDLLKTQYPWKE